ncbi:MAG TPA: hypothetical protein VL380_10620 [Nitrosospira sp.]|nr:hypothetical protein [Nitrosospira sp.]
MPFGLIGALPYEAEAGLQKNGSGCLRNPRVTTARSLSRFVAGT